MNFSNIIPTSKRIERLQYENPWWLSGQVQQTYTDMAKRLYFDLFYPFVKVADLTVFIFLSESALHFSLAECPRHYPA